MPNLVTRKPLSDQEQKKLLLAMKELEARGIELPPDVQKIFEQKKDLKWPVDKNGYFVKKDGKHYEPSDSQAKFINSASRYSLFYGSRGCLDGNTLVGGIPIAEKLFPSFVDTMYGKSLSSPGYLKGKDNLYSVRTQSGNRVVATEHHRFLTSAGWLPLNQLSIGDSILSDGTSCEGTQTGKSPDLTDDCSLDFHLCGELHALLVQVSLDILLQLRKSDGDTCARLSPFRLSIADSLSLMLFQFFLEYSTGLISSEQLSYLFQSVLQSLYILLRSDTFLRPDREDELFEGYGFPSQHGFLKPLSELYSLTVELHQNDLLFDSSFDLQGASRTSSSSPVFPQTPLPAFYSVWAYPYAFRSLHRTYDITSWLYHQINQTLYQRGIRFQFQVPVELFVPNGDVLSLSEAKPLYYRLLQLYKPEQSKSSTRLLSLLQKSLPEFFEQLDCNLSFSVCRFYETFLSSLDKSNSTMKFDKVREIKFEKYGEFYDLQVLGTESYIANGLIHHNSGKSGAGAQKALRKIMQGESGAVINPDFENFRYSTWPELRNWIPWNMVVGIQRHRSRDSWEPHQPFTLSFVNGARMYCKGLKNPDSARGPNINWLWYDEAGRDESGMGWRIATASVRVGKDPQAWATATPRPTEHWMYKFFVKQEIPEEAKAAFDELAQEGKILVEAFHGTIEQNKTHLDPAFYASILTSYPSGYMRAQEVDGEFANEGGKIGDRAWFNNHIITTLPKNVVKKVRSWDTAGTEKKTAKDDPDESVGSLLTKFIPAENPEWLELYRSVIEEGQEKKPHFILEHQVAGCWEWNKLLNVIKNTASHDGPYVEVLIDQDPGGAGKNQIAAIAESFKDEKNPELHSHKITEVEVRKVGDRVLAANAHWFGTAAEGRMWLLKGAWNDGFLGQLDGFTQIAHDDRVTSVTSGMSVLNPSRKWNKMPFVMI